MGEADLPNDSQKREGVGLGSFDLLPSLLENSILFSLTFVQGDHTLEIRFQFEAPERKLSFESRSPTRNSEFSLTTEGGQKSSWNQKSLSKVVASAVIEKGAKRITSDKLPSQVSFLEDSFDHVHRIDLAGMVDPSIPGSVPRFAEGPLNPFQSSAARLHSSYETGEMVLEGLPC